MIKLFRSARTVAPASDAVAGIELAAMSMPQSLGYAGIAGMPAVTGLYTLLLPLLGFAAFGSSRYLVVAADSATAAILAGGLSGLPHAGLTYEMRAALVALLTAVLLLIARVLRLGFLADFLSQTVLTGFLTGVGFQVAIGVLPQMAGINADSRRSILRLIEVLQNLPRANLPSVALSILVIAGVLACSRISPKVPGPLIAVLGSIAASAFWNFAASGIAVIGPVTSGLPHLTLPEISWKEVEPLLPIAASCFVMILTQSAATARLYALSNHEPLNENSDLAGLAAANALASLSGAFVVNGSPTQTSIVQSSGGKGQVAHLTAAVVVAVVLLYFTGPLQYLPRCVLGSIVFIVGVHLLKLRELGAIRRESPGEFFLAVTTAAVVVVVGVEQGIVLAMVMSLLRIVQHSYHPHTALLIPTEDGIWKTIPALPGAVSEPGLIIYRFSAPLFYANAGRFSDEIRNLVTSAPAPIRWVLVDAGPITKLDFSAARVVKDLYAELATHNIVMVWAHVESNLQADLNRHHLTELIGPDRIFDRLHDAIAHYRQLLR